MEPIPWLWPRKMLHVWRLLMEGRSLECRLWKLRLLSVDISCRTTIWCLMWLPLNWASVHRFCSTMPRAPTLESHALMTSWRTCHRFSLFDFGKNNITFVCFVVCKQKHAVVFPMCHLLEAVELSKLCNILKCFISVYVMNDLKFINNNFFSRFSIIRKSYRLILLLSFPFSSYYSLKVKIIHL